MTDLLNTGTYHYQKSFTEKDEDFTKEDITDDHKEWFFKYFNNFNDTEDEEFNKELYNVIERIYEDKKYKKFIEEKEK